MTTSSIYENTHVKTEYFREPVASRRQGLLEPGTTVSAFRVSASYRIWVPHFQFLLPHVRNAESKRASCECTDCAKRCRRFKRRGDKELRHVSLPLLPRYRVIASSRVCPSLSCSLSLSPDPQQCSFLARYLTCALARMLLPGFGSNPPIYSSLLALPTRAVHRTVLRVRPYFVRAQTGLPGPDPYRTSTSCKLERDGTGDRTAVLRITGHICDNI